MSNKLMVMLAALAVALFCCAGTILAQTEEMPADSAEPAVQLEPPPKPVVLAGEDKPNDNGHKLTVKWDYPDDAVGKIQRFDVYRSFSRDGEFKLRGQSPSDYFEYFDIGDKDETSTDYLPNGVDLYYRIVAIGTNGVQAESEIGGPFQTTGQVFHFGKLPVLVAVLLFATFTIVFVTHAKGGKELYVRPLAGIEAVDEAIGRATEMGKPILYILGIGTAAEISTIASFTILGRVAKKVADYQTDLIVPCYDSIVMSVAQDVVRSAYLEAGRPDQYNDDMVFFITNAQFAYVAGVNGIMVRDYPATNFYLGYFAAESLILAETGNSIGAIQIAGTDQITQIPFFVVACDYTLIGEELYAASAYLGRDPLLLGSLKAEDWGKAILMVLLFVGALAVIFGYPELREIVRVNL